MIRNLIKNCYHGFNRFLVKSMIFCWKYSRITLIIFAVITLFLLGNISKMKIVFSAEDLAGQGFPAADELKILKEKYQDGVTSLFILTPPAGKESFTTEELCQIRKWYSFKRISMPEIQNTVSTFDFKLPRRVTEEGRNKLRVINIVDLHCEENELRSTPAQINETLNASPFALIKENRNQLSLLFQFTFKDSTTSKFGSFDPRLFENLRSSVNNELMKIVPDAHVSWIGPGDYQWYILEGFKFSKYINLGMIVLMILGLRLFFGTWLSGILFTSSLFIAAIWIFGLKGLTGSAFDVLSTGLILILGISSLEDFTFTSYEQLKGTQWKKSLLKLAVPSFYTSLTTILGFLSLCTSDVEAVRRMGLWAAWGAFIEWIIIFLLLPSVLQQFKNFKRWADVKKSWKMSFLTSSVFSPMPKTFSKVSLIVYPLAFFAFFRLNYNEAPHRVFPEKQEYSQSLNYLLKTKEWIGSVSLIFDEKMDELMMEKILDDIRQEPFASHLISHTESPWEIKRWLRDQGDLDELESQTFFSISRFHGQFNDDEDKSRALIYLKDTSVVPVETLKKIVETKCQGRCHIGGEIVAYADFAGLVPKTLIDSLVVSLVLVSLIVIFLAVAQNKEKHIPALLLSSFWGAFFVIMLLGYFNITLDFWKSIFASILVGLTGDNAIQYLFASEKTEIARGIESRGAASIITGVLMGITSLVYLGSYFSSPKVFGVILCVGLLTSLFGDLWLFQGFLSFQWGNGRTKK